MAVIDDNCRMPTYTEQKRLSLFDLYVANARLYDELPEKDRFCCPLCRRFFVRDDCLGTDGVLSLAHIYPEALGGKQCTLACRTCNNVWGKKYDCEIVQASKVSSALNPDSTEMIKAEVTLDDLAIRVEFGAKAGEWHLTIPDKPNNPQDIQKWKDRMNALRQPNASQVELNVSFRTEHKAHFNIGILSSAHLLLFSEYGYEYLFSHLGTWIRMQLFNAERGEAISVPIYELRDVDGFDQSTHYRVQTLTDPWERRCLFIVLPTPTPGFVARAVAIPGGVDEPSMAAFEEMQKAGDAGGTFSVLDHPASERLADPRYKGLMHLRWERLTKHRGP